MYNQNSECEVYKVCNLPLNKLLLNCFFSSHSCIFLLNSSLIPPVTEGIEVLIISLTVCIVKINTSIRLIKLTNGCTH